MGKPSRTAKQRSVGGTSVRAFELTCTRSLEFDCAHRLTKHEGKCRNVHGHRYRLELTVARVVDVLDSVGRVVDFAVVRELVGGWIGDHFDHAYVGVVGDPVLRSLQRLGLRVFSMPCEPTAENMVRLLVLQAQRLLERHDVRVVHARLYETPHGWVDWGGG